VTPEQPVFFYDLGSPECYLVGERVMGELDPVPEWEPVHAAALGIELGGGDRDALAAAAAQMGLLAMCWPSVWPADTERAMLTATWAKRGGRAVAYSQAAFRQAFAGGRDLGDEGTVLIAAAACEMHPTAVLKGTGAGGHHASRPRRRPRAVLGPWLSRAGPGRAGAIMKANRVLHLIVTRGGREPVFLADTPFGARGRGRLDRIEVVSVDEGEVVLYWELPAKPAARLLKTLRADLAGLDVDSFLTRWRDADVTADWPL